MGEGAVTRGFGLEERNRETSKNTLQRHEASDGIGNLQKILLKDRKMYYYL